jgi:hypothetical protein
VVPIPIIPVNGHDDAAGKNRSRQHQNRQQHTNAFHDSPFLDGTYRSASARTGLHFPPQLTEGPKDPGYPSTNSRMLKNSYSPRLLKKV